MPMHLGLKNKLGSLKDAIFRVKPESRAARNVKKCGVDGHWSAYFDAAEHHIHQQWDTTIWPLIMDSDFSSVLELAPGAGRNSAKLAELAGELHLIDLNEYALERCRKRFVDYAGNCRIRFSLNDGWTLPMVENESVSFVYSWDSVVHFDKLVVLSYLREFARCLRPGGTGFIHHSNLGDRLYHPLRLNPHWRSNMSKELFAEFCEQVGLQCSDQILVPWGDCEDLDCISLFRKL